MDWDSSSPKLDPKLKAPIRACKTRKVVQTEKSVIRMRIGENVGKLKNQGPPSDSWSWRKYGQKAIKGSPYPRGYYRCTSKGRSAKKQVERSKTDASMLVITYTVAHNHPCPSLQGSRATQQPKERPKSLKQENRAEEASQEDQHADISFENLLKTSVRGSAQGIIMKREGPFSENIDKSHDITLGFVLDEEPTIPCPHHHLMKSLTPNSEGNDIFDELEEL